MNSKCHPVPKVPLRHARTDEEYELHLAALEWSLVEPIVIDRAEDIRSRPSWEGRFEPFEHQVRNLFTFCRRLPVLLLADDVGLGKTISAGLILCELMIRRRVGRALVLCPKILAEQWVEELDSKFGIIAKIALGADLTEELRRQTPVVITTYETARSKLEGVETGAFDMLILDEAHKLRNLHGGQTAPVLAQRVRDALEQRVFKYVLMLTATPLHNRLWDLYSLIDCLTVARGHKHPLGSPDEFRNRFIRPGTDGRKVRPELAEDLRTILRQYLVRTRRGDAKLKFPTRIVKTFPVAPSSQELELTRLVRQHIQHLNPLQQTSLAQALVSSPEALAAQMTNMANNKSLPTKAAVEACRLASSAPQSGKLKGLIDILETLRNEKPQDWRAVVFTHRRETQEAIGRALAGRGITYGFIRGSDARGNQKTIDGFRACPPSANVIISTDAGAEGINLQVANVLVNYDLPWNPMIVEQRIGRIQRLASAHEYVIVYNLVSKGSFEERVVERLLQKLQLIAHAVGDIEAILETVSGDVDEDGESFQEELRKLAIQSILEQDVTQATRLVEESIERARQQLESQRDELEDTLGGLDALHGSGPSMPKLTRLTPGIPAMEFVLRAKKAEGAQILQTGDELYEIQVPGRAPESITFDEKSALSPNEDAVFAGNAPVLYLPGKPAFERLAQHWVDHYGHRIWDVRSVSNKLADELAQSWCETVPGAEFRSAVFDSLSQHFQGSIRIKAKASNTVDSYEKLIKGRVQPEGHQPLPLPSEEARLNHEIEPSEIVPNVQAHVARAVEADKDLVEFCRFYEARRAEEIGKAGSDPARMHKINGDFAPQVFAEIGALNGGRYDRGKLSVRFELDGGEYEVVLDAIPAAEQVLADPPRRPCELSGRIVPENCLDTCAISGQIVLKHLLAESAESRRKALLDHVVRCPLSGRQVLQDELTESALTGQRAVSSLFKESPVSGRKGLTDDFARCQVTDIEVLRDELVESQVSGRLFRRDEQLGSAVSGVTGHRSEFLLCERTGQPLLESEAGRSAVSGKVVRSDLLSCSAKSPGRLGLPNEFVKCAATGKLLLSDEVGCSAVSGKWYDRDLLTASACSQQLALVEEMVTCQETGVLLLPAETGVCSITGKRVDARLLSPSEHSGAIALTKLMVRWAKTKKLVLPSELVKCSVTKARVLLTEVEVCAVTGRRALRDRLLRSDVTGRYMLPEHAVTSAVSDRICLPSESVLCVWLEARILFEEAGACRLTGQTVAKKYLNDKGELRALRNLLDGRGTNTTSDEGTSLWLRSQQDGALGGMRRVECRSSPRGGVLAVCGELRTFPWLWVRHAGLLVRIRGEREILGRIVIGRRAHDGWVETEVI